MSTAESRKALSDTIRALRERLLTELHKHGQSRLQLHLSLEKCSLDGAPRVARERLERWLDERERASVARTKESAAQRRQRALESAVHECAATWLNRLVILRVMEAQGLSSPKVLTGGWRSVGYREFREWAPALCEDESEGYATLLAMVFREHAVELPGLFGEVGVSGLFEVPVATLRAMVDALDDESIADVWADDTTPGWVYQYWNDPAREHLDEGVSLGKKIENHEIASKTQMFTERYMVEWLLQNTLGLQWLALCQKKGWTADATRVLPALAQRRADYRELRSRGEIQPDVLMPVDEGLERRWCYWVEQPVPEGLVRAVPESVREWRVLDPACGSGHFLVIAFGLLFELYREEARHRGEQWSDREIAESIVEHNLHGVDLDRRAVQLAAAALWLRMKTCARDARPARMNLVATAFELGHLRDDDPALAQLQSALEACGLAASTVRSLVRSLAELDTWGTLVRIDDAITKLLRDDAAGFVDGARAQLSLGEQSTDEQRARAHALTAGARAQRAEVIAQIERFLSEHTRSSDLGVRLDGEQLAAGVRFAQMMRDASFDVVVGNPPYHTTAKLANGAEIAKRYPDAKSDLFAAFYVRGLELAKQHGCVGLVTLSNWMFLGSFELLRAHMLEQQLRMIADFGKAAFQTGGTLISTSATIVERTASERACIVVRPNAPSEVIRDDGQPQRTHAGLLLQRERFVIEPSAFHVIEGAPIVYWWSGELLERYRTSVKFSEYAPAKFGLTTGDNERFVRRCFEVAPRSIREPVSRWDRDCPWVPFVLGAKGRAWFEELSTVVAWSGNGLDVKLKSEWQYGSVSKQIRNEDVYFRRGVAFSMIGARFTARVHRHVGVIGNMGSSVFPDDVSSAVCSMNTTLARSVLESLNPGLHFEVGDVNRLPLFPVEGAEAIYARLDEAFTQHERAREASVEFVAPGRSAWGYAQAWAQKAVDRGAGEPLPEYAPSESDWLPPDSASDPTASAAEHEKRAAFDRVSYALGVAMGRFGASGEGVLASAPDTALPAGILFVSVTGEGDSVDTRACAPLRAAFAEYGAALTEEKDLRVWLRKELFALHKERYENRPIYFPLSSAKKSFVAWVSVHRWTKNTLKELLADHLEPLRRGLENEQRELRAAKDRATDKKQKTAADKKLNELSKWLEELQAMIDHTRAISDEGAPPVGDKGTARERAHPFVMDLDDGVMINSAALWPLLEAQWKDPKKWWAELSAGDDRKHYDWAKMAQRYWPDRVRARCVEDPSLAVAHGCFWELHPEKAWRWEQRLKESLGDDWVIDESGASERRAAWVRDNGPRAREISEEERVRRERKAKREESEESEESEEGE